MLSTQFPFLYPFLSHITRMVKRICIAKDEEGEETGEKPKDARSETRSESHDLNQTLNSIAFHSDGNTAFGASEADENHLDPTAGQTQPGVSAANGAQSTGCSGDNWDVSSQSPQFSTGMNSPKRVNYSVSKLNGLSISRS